MIHQSITDQVLSARYDDINSRLTLAARSMSRKYNNDLNEIINMMWHAILEKARKDQTFLQQSDSYIVQHGVWAVKSYERANRRIKTVRLNDEIIDNQSDSATPDRTTVMATLPADLRRTVEMMLEKPNVYYLNTGRINTTRMAAEMGKSWHTADSQLKKIRGVLISRLGSQIW